MTALRHPHKAYRLLDMLRRIRNPADAERIEELRQEIGAYWDSFRATPKGKREMAEYGAALKERRRDARP